jgi:hypothetical protein
MGNSSSRVDKIIVAYRQNNYPKILDLCKFENGKIKEKSILPHEIVEVIKIMKTLSDSRDNDYYLPRRNSDYQPILINNNNNLIDGVHFMITNVCYKITFMRSLPILIELLYKENINRHYIEGIIKNIDSNRFDIGYVHSSIITYLCFNDKLKLNNRQLYELLKLLASCGIQVDVNPSISVYRDDSGVYNQGNSVLMEIAKKNYQPLIQLFLDSRANYKQVNKYGLTYYDYLNDKMKEIFRDYNPYGDESNV